MKLILLLIFLTLSLHASEKSILLLHSYNRGLIWSDDISLGVEEKLSEFTNVELTTEYMDSKKNNTLEYKIQTYKIFTEKFKKRSYDIIIAADNFAVNFVLKNKEKLFPKSNIIFCGLDKDYPGVDIEKILSENISVVLENKQVNKNVDLILQILPNTEHIYIINDTSPSSLLVNIKIKNSILKFKNIVNFSFNTSGNFNKINEELKHLPPKSAILLGSLFIDERGKFISNYKIKEFIENSNIPIFALLDYNLSEGIIGGLLTRGVYQGKESANIAANILKNRKIDYRTATNTRADLIYDYNILKKFKITTNNIPSDAKIINIPKDFFERNKEVINTSFLIFPFVLISLIIAIIAIIMKNKTQKILRVQKRLSEAQLNNLESFVFWIDDTGEIKGCNHSFKNFINKKRSEIIGKNIDEILFFINEIISKELIFDSRYFEFSYKKREYLVKNKYIKNEFDNLEAVTIITDVTEKKEAEINKQFIIQQSKLTEVGEMLSALVHQWKAPLVELSAIAHKMHYYNKKNKLESVHIDDFYENIMKQTIFMSETMDTFRGFIKVSNTSVSFDISLGIREILDMLKESLMYNNIQVEYINILDTSIYLDGYPNEFKQVILNLINNAKDSIIESRKKDNTLTKGQIKIILAQIEESVKIKIVDDGLGFNDGLEQKVFDPYYTTKNEGIGIGLYMAKLIIENKMNGKINAYNNATGAKFVITLPKSKK